MNLPCAPTLWVPASSQDDDPFRSTASTALASPLSQGQCLPASLVLPCLEESRNPLPGEQQSALPDGKQPPRLPDGPGGMRPCALRVAASPHGVASPRSPTAHPHSRVFCMNHGEHHHGTAENATCSSRPSGTFRAVQAQQVKLLKQRPWITNPKPA